MHQSALTSTFSWVFSSDLASDFEATNTPATSKAYILSEIKNELMKLDRFIGANENTCSEASRNLFIILHHLVMGIYEGLKRTPYFEEMVEAS